MEQDAFLSDDRTYIVGIGASAGGLEALQNFFQHLSPELNAAYVVVQHLSPDFKSMMLDLLAKTTEMPIHSVVDGMRITRNNVYLIPPRFNMVVEHGALRLIEQPEHRTLNLPIDLFYSSMARDRGANCFAVVLSGTGSDGSRGILNVKEAGGFVIVQDPEEAKFDGMPNSAVRTGLADLVLAARKIPEQIKRFLDARMAGALFDNSEASLTTVFRTLAQQTGVDFSKYKPSTVARRIERRMTVHHLQTLSEYVEKLKDDAREPTILCRELLINVTQFFRDKEAFEIIDRDVIAKIVADSSANHDIRIWCAGCATGEEAYSLAMLVSEAIASQNLDRDFKVFATDVDAEAIEVGAAGVYDGSISEDLGQARTHRHLIATGGDRLVISPKLRAKVVFAVHDITEDPPFSNMDLVVCRNLLIYLRNDVQQQVLSQLFYAVRKDGFLFLGSSESLGEMATHFDVVNVRNKIYRKISRASPRLHTKLIDRRIDSVAARSERSAPPPSLPNLVADSLLSRYMPPTIIVDDNDEAVYVYGDVAPYVKKLPPGDVRNRVSRLLLDSLQVPVSTASHRARTSKKAVLYANVGYNADGPEPHSVSIRLTPLDNPKLVNFLAITFESDQVQTRNDAAEINYNPDTHAAQRIEDLENELTHTREHLQVTIEELKTTNEELQASNEELLAANEELQSTNEELQSVNEELYTVNSEYQEKIQEISDVNEDLHNVLRNTNLAVVFLHADLTIRRFTDTARAYVNLVEQDLGRPFRHVTNNLNYEDFQDEINKVVINQDRLASVVEGAGHSLIEVIIDPFYSAEQEAAGIVITFYNVTERLETQQRLASAEQLLEQRESERHFDIALELANIGLWRWDVSNEVMYWDQRMYSLAGIQNQNAVPGPDLLLDAAHPLDRPELKRRLSRILAGEPMVAQFRIRGEGERIGHLQAEPIRDADGTLQSVVGVWADDTKQRTSLLHETAAGEPVPIKSHDTAVLIVDDDDRDASLVTQYVQRAEPTWLTQTVRNLESGCDQLRNGRFSAVVLDLSLPDAIDAEAVMHINAVDANVPIIVLTGNEDGATLERALELGAQDYIVKRNLSSDMVVESIRKSIKRKQVQTSRKAS